MTAPTPATQTTLADWLAARLDEDEAAASNPSRAHFVSTAGGFEEHDCVDLEETYLVADPARVLADVAAKRAIVALHEPQDAHWAFSSHHSHHTPTCTECVSFHADADCENEPWPCPTLRHLASVYRDAPGWDERWAVS